MNAPFETHRGRSGNWFRVTQLERGREDIHTEAGLGARLRSSRCPSRPQQVLAGPCSALRVAPSWACSMLARLSFCSLPPAHPLTLRIRAASPGPRGSLQFPSGTLSHFSTPPPLRPSSSPSPPPTALLPSVQRVNSCPSYLHFLLLALC